MKTCEGCGRTFEPRTAHATRRWCTRWCGSMARKRAQREIRKAERARLRALPNKPSVVATAGARARNCEVCSAAFLVAYPQQRYCGVGCSNRARSEAKQRERLAELEARFRTPVVSRRRMQSLLLAQPLVNAQRCERCRGNLIVQADEELRTEVVCLACGERPKTLPPRLERVLSRITGVVA